MLINRDLEYLMYVSTTNEYSYTTISLNTYSFPRLSNVSKHEPTSFKTTSWLGELAGDPKMADGVFSYDDPHTFQTSVADATSLQRQSSF